MSTSMVRKLNTIYFIVGQKLNFFCLSFIHVQKQAHKYFDRIYSEWDIVDFLNNSNESEFQDLDLSQKIGIYLKSLEVIMDADKGQRGKRAKELHDRYKQASFPFVILVKKYREFGGVVEDL